MCVHLKHFTEELFDLGAVEGASELPKQNQLIDKINVDVEVLVRVAGHRGNVPKAALVLT